MQSSRNFHFSCHTRVLHQGRLCTRQRVFSLTSLAAISVYMIATYRCYTSESNLNGCNFRKESRRKLFYIPKESAKIAAFDSNIIEFSSLYHRFMFIGVYLKTTNCGIWSLFAYPVTYTGEFETDSCERTKLSTSGRKLKLSKCVCVCVKRHRWRVDLICTCMPCQIPIRAYTYKSLYL